MVWTCRSFKHTFPPGLRIAIRKRDPRRRFETEQVIPGADPNDMLFFASLPVCSVSLVIDIDRFIFAGEPKPIGKAVHEREVAGLHQDFQRALRIEDFG